MTEKKIHIIYYGTDSEKAKEIAASVRADRKTAQVRHAEIFDGFAEPADRVMILTCVSGHDAARIKDAYGDKVANVATPPPLPVMPPPPAVDPVTPPPVPSRKVR